MDRVGVLTSGGDCQGMNSVLFGLIHSAQASNTDVFLIKDGYRGLLNGGPDFILKADNNFIKSYQAGTMIGSSRCPEFLEVDGRRKAALNLMKLNINKLVIVGGDGSLTGAMLMKKEWSQFCDELQSQSDSSLRYLNIVGVVGSIDNDFFGTEMTIGADSALCRVIESIDTLKTTAASHHRVMVVEVMGRNCGYIALSTAMATEVTYVFVPECPQQSDQHWKQKLQTRIRFEQSHGQQFHIIIVAEGACDVNGNSIPCSTIRQYLSKELNLDTRVVVLGHVQRGGQVSAFDRLLSTQMGIEAFQHLKSCNGEQDPHVMTLDKGRILMKPLSTCIQGITFLANFMKANDWNSVLSYRGDHFKQTWNNYRKLMNSKSNIPSGDQRWCVVNDGSSVPGVNAIIYAIVRFANASNVQVFAVRNGIEGLVNDRYEQLQWADVAGYTALSGSHIGCNTTIELINKDNISTIVNNLHKNNVNSMCIIGDAQTFENVILLKQMQSTFEILKQIKICFIPVTSEQCKYPIGKLGYDSILNKTFQLLTDLTVSIDGTQNQLFLIRLSLSFSQNDFFNSKLFGLVTNTSFIYHGDNNKSIDNEQINSDASQVKNILFKTKQNQFVLINDLLFNKVFNIYQDVFKDCKQIQIKLIDLTNIQMPMRPTPYDRKLGVKLGMQCSQYFSDCNIISTPVYIENSLFNIVPI